MVRKGTLGNDPAKRQAWKDQEKKLTNLCKKARKDMKEGNSNKIVTPEEMAKLTKFAKNGCSKEISLVKDANGKKAASPDEAL